MEQVSLFNSSQKKDDQKSNDGKNGSKSDNKAMQKPQSTLPKLAINSALEERLAIHDSVFWHRLLLASMVRQNNRTTYLQILQNEMHIKNGDLTPLRAIQDSLIQSFRKK